jgi:cysteine desulfurase
MQRIYLDHQASTPVVPAALAEIFHCFSETWANPHSEDHAEGWRASAEIEAARGRIAIAVGADAGEIVFTSGATEANNIALLGVAAAAPDAPRRIVTIAIEHKAVLAPARALAERGWELVVVPVGRDGIVDVGALESALAPGAALVSIGAANNEIGTVQPLADIAPICHRAGALFHTDAAQALAWRGVDVVDSGVDLMSLSAHKAGGPKGVGALFVAHAARDRIWPVLHGGGQEGGLRPGTLPTPLCVGFGAACDALPDADGVAAWRAVTGRLLSGLRSIWPDLGVNGAAGAHHHPGNLSVTLPGVEVDALIARLQPRIAVSRGSACTSGFAEPSHVLTAIGLDAQRAEATVRLSTGVATTADEVDEAVRLFGLARDTF